VRCLDLKFPGRVQVTVELPRHLRQLQLARALGSSVVKSITFDSKLHALDTGWTPPGGHWATAGTFFHETAEFFDPVQGAVANCYYIAALSAMAWASPFRIAHLTRATGNPQDQFNDMIRFCRPDSGGATDQEVQVTENLALSGGGNFIYCGSSETGETWPAVY